MNDLLQFIPLWEITLFAFVFGTLWGSFANVFIVRWPAEISVVKPPSHCFSCKEPIRWYDNIPLISYMLLRGKCRRCNAKFSPRYFFVELAMGLLAAAVMYRSIMVSSDITTLLSLFAMWFYFIFAMVVIALVDLKHYLVPDVLVLPGVIIGIAGNAFIPVLGLVEPAVAAGIGYAGLRLLFIDGYKLLTGKAGMGLGDAKLLAMFGAFMGYEGVLFALFAGALQGTIVGVAMVLMRRKDGLDNEPVFEEERDEEGNPIDTPDHRLRKARIPFGPFLALGAVEYYFFGQYLTAQYHSALVHLIYGVRL